MWPFISFNLLKVDATRGLLLSDENFWKTFMVDAMTVIRSGGVMFLGKEASSNSSSGALESARPQK